jgi:hypothetical protein
MEMDTSASHDHILEASERVYLRLREKGILPNCTREQALDLIVPVVRYYAGKKEPLPGVFSPWAVGVPLIDDEEWEW